MALKIPTPPTPPAPPVPPSIDLGDVGKNSAGHSQDGARKFIDLPFGKKSDDESQSTDEKNSEEVQSSPEPQQNPPATTQQNQNQQPNRTVTTPETLARDAVANGAGPLTKRTVTGPEQGQQTGNRTPQVTRIPAGTETMTDRDGREILREFQREDGETGQNLQTQNQQPAFLKNFNQEGHGGIFWVLTLLFAAVLSFVFVQKFLLKKNPALKASDLFADAGTRLKNTEKKFAAPIEKPAPAKKYSPRVETKKPVRPAPVAKSPAKPDDDKGKHFEVRI